MKNMDYSSAKTNERYTDQFNFIVETHWCRSMSEHDRVH